MKESIPHTSNLLPPYPFDDLPATTSPSSFHFGIKKSSTYPANLPAYQTTTPSPPYSTHLRSTKSLPPVLKAGIKQPSSLPDPPVWSGKHEHLPSALQHGTPNLKVSKPEPLYLSYDHLDTDQRTSKKACQRELNDLAESKRFKEHHKAMQKTLKDPRLYVAYNKGRSRRGEHNMLAKHDHASNRKKYKSSKLNFLNKKQIKVDPSNLGF